MLSISKNKHCNHRRTFEFYPETVNCFWFRDGESKGNHSGIKICGCLDCGKMWCRDYEE